MQGIIGNAKDKSLTDNPGTLPDMSATLSNYFQPLTFTKLTKEIIDFKVVEDVKAFTFMGVRQPMSAQRIQMKPEGQRAWKWETIHTFDTLVLAIDDVITFNTIKYRVKDKWNYAQYGFLVYDIIEDYTT